MVNFQANSKRFLTFFMVSILTTLTLDARVEPLAVAAKTNPPSSFRTTTAPKKQVTTVDTQPFQSNWERNTALKEIIISHSTFLQSAPQDIQLKIKANPQMLKIDINNKTTAVNIYNSRITLHINKNEIPVHTARNRAELKKIIDDNAFTFGHEGGHVSQGLENVLYVTGYSLLHDIIECCNTGDLVPLSLDPLGAKNTLDPNILRFTQVTPTYLMEDPTFQKHLGTFQNAAIDYTQACCTTHPSPSSYKANKELMIKMGAFAAINSRYIETDADRQGIESVVNNSRFTTAQKINILKIAQKFFKKDCASQHYTVGYSDPQCEHFLSTHPPCKDRIAHIETAIQKLTLLP